MYEITISANLTLTGAQLDAVNDRESDMYKARS